MYSFDLDDIRKQVLDFLASLDIQPADELDIVLDGELHRYRVHNDKRSDKSGAVCIHTDGWPAGFVQDWRGGFDTKKTWKYDASNLDDEQKKYFSSEEFKRKCEEEHERAEKARQAKRLERSGFARKLWEKLEPAPEDHPYLQRKQVNNYGLRFNPTWPDGKIDFVKDCLAVPLCNIEGQVMSIQWIPADAEKNKLFYWGAALDGTFFSIAIDSINKDSEQVILLGEGYATMAKVYELTEYPCVAAMTCSRLWEVAKILHENYPKCKVVVTADNDWGTEVKRGYNPGIKEAVSVVSRKWAIDYIYPDFTPADTGMSDWVTKLLLKI